MTKTENSKRTLLNLTIMKLRVGFLKKIYLYIPVAAFTAVFCIMTYKSASFIEAECNIGLADLIFGFFKGIPFYIKGNGMPLELPITWFFYLLFLLFIIGYGYKLHTGYMIGNILVRCKDKKRWWYSECIYAAICVIVYYMVTFLTITFIVLCKNGNLAELHRNILKILFNVDLKMNVQGLDMWKYFMMPFLTSLSLVFIELFLNLIIKPLYSFITMFVLLICAAYFRSGLFIGSFSMLQRSLLIEENGHKTIELLIYGSCIIFSSTFIGRYLIQRKDIIN